MEKEFTADFKKRMKELATCNVELLKAAKAVLGDLALNCANHETDIPGEVNRYRAMLRRDQRLRDAIDRAERRT